MTMIPKILAFFILTSSFNFSQPEWQQLNSGTNNYLYDLYFISESTGWVIGDSGIILKTTNGGSSWLQENSNTSTNLRTVFFLNDQLGWVGGYNGLLLKTTDGGESWQSSRIGFGTEDIYSLSFISENIGHAVIGKVLPSSYSGDVIRTTDGGNSWQQKLFVNGDALLAVVAKGENAWAVGTGIAAHTTNTGEFWSFIFPPTGQWLYDVYFLDDVTGWAVGGGSDSEIILKSANSGLTWQIMRESFQYQRLQGVCFTNVNNGWTVGENGVILYTTDGGMNWNPHNSPTNNFLREVQFPSPVTGFIVGANGTILKYSENSTYINVIIPNGGEIITAGSTYNIEWNSLNVIDVKIEYSTDNGVNWIEIIDSFPSTGIYTWTVPNILTTQGRVQISDITDPAIFDISNDSFTIQSSKSITVVTPNGGEVLNGGSQYDITWSSNDVNDVKIEYSINNGASWNLIVDNYPSTGIYNWVVPNILTIQARVKISDFILASISDISDEPFRINLVVSVDDQKNITEYKLFQNYPNPFNPSTLIKYSIPGNTFVTINIYDVLGNLVRTLLSDEISSGNHSIEFRGEDLPSGIYLYKMITATFVDSKKMILLK